MLFTMTDIFANNNQEQWNPLSTILPEEENKRTYVGPVRSDDSDVSDDTTSTSTRGNNAMRLEQSNPPSPTEIFFQHNAEFNQSKDPEIPDADSAFKQLEEDDILYPIFAGLQEDMSDGEIDYAVQKKAIEDLIVSNPDVFNDPESTQGLLAISDIFGDQFVFDLFRKSGAKGSLDDKRGGIYGPVDTSKLMDLSSGDYLDKAKSIWEFVAKNDDDAAIDLYNRTFYGKEKEKDYNESVKRLNSELDWMKSYSPNSEIDKDESGKMDYDELFKTSKSLKPNPRRADNSGKNTRLSVTMSAIGNYSSLNPADIENAIKSNREALELILSKGSRSGKSTNVISTASIKGKQIAKGAVFLPDLIDKYANDAAARVVKTEFDSLKSRGVSEKEISENPEKYLTPMTRDYVRSTAAVMEAMSKIAGNESLASKIFSGVIDSMGYAAYIAIAAASGGASLTNLAGGARSVSAKLFARAPKLVTKAAAGSAGAKLAGSMVYLTHTGIRESIGSDTSGDIKLLQNDKGVYGIERKNQTVTDIAVESVKGWAEGITEVGLGPASFTVKGAYAVGKAGAGKIAKTEAWGTISNVFEKAATNVKGVIPDYITKGTGSIKKALLENKAIKTIGKMSKGSGVGKLAKEKFAIDGFGEEFVQEFDSHIYSTIAGDTNLKDFFSFENLANLAGTIGLQSGIVSSASGAAGSIKYSSFALDNMIAKNKVENGLSDIFGVDKSNAKAITKVLSESSPAVSGKIVTSMINRLVSDEKISSMSPEETINKISSIKSDVAHLIHSSFRMAALEGTTPVSDVDLREAYAKAASEFESSIVGERMSELVNSDMDNSIVSAVTLVNGQRKRVFVRDGVAINRDDDGNLSISSTDGKKSGLATIVYDGGKKSSVDISELSDVRLFENASELSQSLIDYNSQVAVNQVFGAPNNLGYSAISSSMYLKERGIEEYNGETDPDAIIESMISDGAIGLTESMDIVTDKEYEDGAEARMERFKSTRTSSIADSVSNTNPSNSKKVASSRIASIKSKGDRSLSYEMKVAAKFSLLDDDSDSDYYDAESEDAFDIDDTYSDYDNIPTVEEESFEQDAIDFEKSDSVEVSSVVSISRKGDSEKDSPDSMAEDTLDIQYSREKLSGTEERVLTASEADPQKAALSWIYPGEEAYGLSIETVDEFGNVISMSLSPSEEMPIYFTKDRKVVTKEPIANTLFTINKVNDKSVDENGVNVGDVNTRFPAGMFKFFNPEQIKGASVTLRTEPIMYKTPTGGRRYDKVPVVRFTFANGESIDYSLMPLEVMKLKRDSGLINEFGFNTYANLRQALIDIAENKSNANSSVYISMGKPKLTSHDKSKLSEETKKSIEKSKPEFVRHLSMGEIDKVTPTVARDTMSIVISYGNDESGLNSFYLNSETGRFELFQGKISYNGALAVAPITHPYRYAYVDVYGPSIESDAMATAVAVILKSKNSEYVRDVLNGYNPELIETITNSAFFDHNKFFAALVSGDITVGKFKDIFLRIQKGGYAGESSISVSGDKLYVGKSMIGSIDEFEYEDLASIVNGRPLRFNISEVFNGPYSFATSIPKLFNIDESLLPDYNSVTEFLFDNVLTSDLEDSIFSPPYLFASVEKADESGAKVEFKLDEESESPESFENTPQMRAFRDVLSDLFGVDIVTSQSEINKVLNQAREIGAHSVEEKDFGKIKGFVYDGKIYLKNVNPFTTVHESGHLIINALIAIDPEFSKKFLDKLTEEFPEYYESLKLKYGTHGDPKVELFCDLLAEKSEEAIKSKPFRVALAEAYHRFINMMRRALGLREYDGSARVYESYVKDIINKSLFDLIEISDIIHSPFINKRDKLDFLRMGCAIDGMKDMVSIPYDGSQPSFRKSGYAKFKAKTKSSSVGFFDYIKMKMAGKGGILSDENGRPIEVYASNETNGIFAGRDMVLSTKKSNGAKGYLRNGKVLSVNPEVNFSGIDAYLRYDGLMNAAKKAGYSYLSYVDSSGDRIFVPLDRSTFYSDSMYASVDSENLPSSRGARAYAAAKMYESGASASEIMAKTSMIVDDNGIVDVEYSDEFVDVSAFRSGGLFKIGDIYRNEELMAISGLNPETRVMIAKDESISNPIVDSFNIYGEGKINIVINGNEPVDTIKDLVRCAVIAYNDSVNIKVLRDNNKGLESLKMPHKELPHHDPIGALEMFSELMWEPSSHDAYVEERDEAIAAVYDKYGLIVTGPNSVLQSPEIDASAISLAASNFISKNPNKSEIPLLSILPKFILGKVDSYKNYKVKLTSDVSLSIDKDNKLILISAESSDNIGQLVLRAIGLDELSGKSVSNMTDAEVNFHFVESMSMNDSRLKEKVSRSEAIANSLVERFLSENNGDPLTPLQEKILISQTGCSPTSRGRFLYNNGFKPFGYSSAKTAIRELKKSPFVKRDIGDFLSEDLMKAYPDLSNVSLAFVNDPSAEYAGYYDHEKKAIFINESSPLFGFMISSNTVNEIIATINHEIQHAIQDISRDKIGSASAFFGGAGYSTSIFTMEHRKEFEDFLSKHPLISEYVKRSGNLTDRISSFADMSKQDDLYYETRDKLISDILQARANNESLLTSQFEKDPSALRKLAIIINRSTPFYDTYRNIISETIAVHSETSKNDDKSHSAVFGRGPVESEFSDKHKRLMRPGSPILIAPRGADSQTSRSVEATVDSVLREAGRNRMSVLINGNEFTPSLSDTHTSFVISELNSFLLPIARTEQSVLSKEVSDILDKNKSEFGVHYWEKRGLSSMSRLRGGIGRIEFSLSDSPAEKEKIDSMRLRDEIENLILGHIHREFSDPAQWNDIEYDSDLLKDMMSAAVADAQARLQSRFTYDGNINEYVVKYANSIINCIKESDITDYAAPIIAAAPIEYANGKFKNISRNSARAYLTRIARGFDGDVASIKDKIHADSQAGVDVARAIETSSVINKLGGNLNFFERIASYYNSQEMNVTNSSGSDVTESGKMAKVFSAMNKINLAISSMGMSNAIKVVESSIRDVNAVMENGGDSKAIIDIVYNTFGLLGISASRSEVNDFLVSNVFASTIGEKAITVLKNAILGSIQGQVKEVVESTGEISGDGYSEEVTRTESNINTYTQLGKMVNAIIGKRSVGVSLSSSTDKDSVSSSLTKYDEFHVVADGLNNMTKQQLLERSKNDSLLFGSKILAALLRGSKIKVTNPEKFPDATSMSMLVGEDMVNVLSGRISAGQISTKLRRVYFDVPGVISPIFGYTSSDSYGIMYQEKGSMFEHSDGKISVRDSNDSNIRLMEMSQRYAVYLASELLTSIESFDRFLEKKADSSKHAIKKMDYVGKGDKMKPGKGSYASEHMDGVLVKVNSEFANVFPKIAEGINLSKSVNRLIDWLSSNSTTLSELNIVSNPEAFFTKMYGLNPSAATTTGRSYSPRVSVPSHIDACIGRAIDLYNDIVSRNDGKLPAAHAARFIALNSAIYNSVDISGVVSNSIEEAELLIKDHGNDMRYMIAALYHQGAFQSKEDVETPADIKQEMRVVSAEEYRAMAESKEQEVDSKETIVDDVIGSVIDDKLSLIADMILMKKIGYIEANKALLGDLRLYGSFAAMSKRMSSWDTNKALLSKDSTEESDGDNMIKVQYRGDIIANEGLDTETADTPGMVLISPGLYRKIMIRGRGWSAERDAVFERILQSTRGGEAYEPIVGDFSFPPLKLIGLGEHDAIHGKKTKTLLKANFVPLFSDPDRKFGDAIDMLSSGEVDMIAFEDSVKYGYVDKAIGNMDIRSLGFISAPRDESHTRASILRSLLYYTEDDLTGFIRNNTDKQLSNIVKSFIMPDGRVDCGAIADALDSGGFELSSTSGKRVALLRAAHEYAKEDPDNNPLDVYGVFDIVMPFLESRISDAFDFKLAGGACTAVASSLYIGRQLKFEDTNERVEIVAPIATFDDIVGGMPFDKARKFLVDNGYIGDGSSGAMLIRNPIQGDGSISKATIVDVFEPMYGNSVAAPAEFLDQSGGDLDGDKYFIFLPSSKNSADENALIKNIIKAPLHRSNSSVVRELEEFYDHLGALEKSPYRTVDSYIAEMYSLGFVGQCVNMINGQKIFSGAAAPGGKHGLDSYGRSEADINAAASSVSLLFTLVVDIANEPVIPNYGISDKDFLAMFAIASFNGIPTLAKIVKNRAIKKYYDPDVKGNLDKIEMPIGEYFKRGAEYIAGAGDDIDANAASQFIANAIEMSNIYSLLKFKDDLFTLPSRRGVWSDAPRLFGRKDESITGTRDGTIRKIEKSDVKYGDGVLNVNTGTSTSSASYSLIMSSIDDILSRRNPYLSTKFLSNFYNVLVKNLGSAKFSDPVKISKDIVRYDASIGILRDIPADVIEDMRYKMAVMHKVFFSTDKDNAIVNLSSSEEYIMDNFSKYEGSYDVVEGAFYPDGSMMIDDGEHERLFSSMVALSSGLRGVENFRRSVYQAKHGSMEGYPRKSYPSLSFNSDFDMPMIPMKGSASSLSPMLTSAISALYPSEEASSLAARSIVNKPHNAYNFTNSDPREKREVRISYSYVSRGVKGHKDILVDMVPDDNSVSIVREMSIARDSGETIVNVNTDIENIQAFANAHGASLVFLGESDIAIKYSSGNIEAASSIEDIEPGSIVITDLSSVDPENVFVLDSIAEVSDLFIVNVADTMSGKNGLRGLNRYTSDNRAKASRDVNMGDLQDDMERISSSKAISINTSPDAMMDMIDRNEIPPINKLGVGKHVFYSDSVNSVYDVVEVTGIKGQYATVKMDNGEYQTINLRDKESPIKIRPIVPASFLYRYPQHKIALYTRSSRNLPAAQYSGRGLEIVRFGRSVETTPLHSNITSKKQSDICE